MTTNSNSCAPQRRSNQTTRNRNQYFHHVPKINLFKQEDGLQLEMAIPGIDKSEVAIKVENGQLTISHTGSESTDRKFIKKGFDLNGFSRTFTLSKDVDAEKIEATFDMGILRLQLPIKETAKPKTISIQ